MGHLGQHGQGGPLPTGHPADSLAAGQWLLASDCNQNLKAPHVHYRTHSRHMAVTTSGHYRGHIKSPKRTRLHTATVDSLMRVGLLSGSDTLVLGSNYTASTLLTDAAAALEFYDSDSSLVKRLHQQLANTMVSDEVLDADSAAAAELAAVLLPGGQTGDQGDSDSDAAYSEGSELEAVDPEVEAALQASWQRTLQELGLAPASTGAEELEAADEGAAAGAGMAGAEEENKSDTDSIDAAMGW